MKKVIINQNEKGFLFKNGKFVKLLDCGKYYITSDKEIIISDLSQNVYCNKCPLELLLADEKIKNQTVIAEVGDQQIALHYVNGKFNSMLHTGKYAFWKTTDNHEFKVFDISSPIVDKAIPEFVFSKIPSSKYIMVEVAEFEKGRLYLNHKFEKLLDAGTYYFWKTNISVQVELVDTRLMQMDITGQEILTSDKVSLRINFVCNYRIKDYIRIRTEVSDYWEQLHVACQLALREYVSKYKLDDILENKEQMSEFVFSKLKAKEKELFIEITHADVKDIIIPGEIRSIMNTVLVAEKRAQANVITRREEVASTRSLLNTAKLMDENKTLYKLKELEYIERICENVGNISLSGNGNILTQLGEMLCQKGKEQ